MPRPKAGQLGNKGSTALLALPAAEGDLHPGGEAKGIQMARRS